jgi:DNA-binding NarL/FixJ family response regulator
MNGIEVLEWIQAQDFPDLKVAMLADSSDSIFRAQALKLGVDHFYPKSIGIDQLAGVVKDLEAKIENGDARIP